MFGFRIGAEFVDHSLETDDFEKLPDVGSVDDHVEFIGGWLVVDSEVTLNGVRAVEALQGDLVFFVVDENRGSFNLFVPESEFFLLLVIGFDDFHVLLLEILVLVVEGKIDHEFVVEEVLHGQLVE